MAFLSRSLAVALTQRAAVRSTFTYVAPCFSVQNLTTHARLLTPQKASTLVQVRTQSSSAAAASATEHSESFLHSAKFNFLSSLTIGLLTPAAFYLSPSTLVLPIDLVLGVLFPLHGYVGCVHIINDYVPKGLRGIATVLTGALSLLAGIGILNMNLRGPGFTESVKTLWRKKSFVEEE